MSFTIFYNEKTPFQAIKTRNLKSLKISIFPKGLTHLFCTKLAIFFNFFFLGNIAQENVFYVILERKNAFLGYKNKKFKKCKNCHFSNTVNRWFWSKKVHFFTQYIQARKMSFTISYNEKAPFQAIKRKSSKCLKIEIFPKGLTHGFRTKMAIFRNFFFQPIQARKMSFTIFYKEKTPFQAMQKGSKNRKIAIFPKGLTHGFGPKIAIFSTFFFRQYRQGKCYLQYSRTKRLFSTL